MRNTPKSNPLPAARKRRNRVVKKYGSRPKTVAQRIHESAAEAVQTPKVEE